MYWKKWLSAMHACMYVCMHAALKDHFLLAAEVQLVSPEFDFCTRGVSASEYRRRKRRRRGTVRGGGAQQEEVYSRSRYSVQGEEE